MTKKKSESKTTSAFKKNSPGKSYSLKDFFNLRIKPLMPVFQFVGIFLLIVGSYYAFITSDLKEILGGYLALTAKLSSFFLNILGEESSVNAQVINSTRTSISIGFGCDGLDPIAIFFAAVVATPVKWLYKLIGIVIGAVIIYFFNFARIIGLYYIRINWSEAFDSMHFEIFPIFFIILSIVLYGFWQYLVLKRRKAEPLNA